MNILKKLTKQREFMILAVIIVICIFMSFASPVFLSTSNFLALLMSVSVNAIMAVGMTILMVSGGFDMSVGSMLGFSGIVVAMSLKAGIPVIISIIISLLVSCAIGLFNGVCIAKIGINSFVTTLASQSLFRGLTLVFSQGQNITALPPSFNAIGQTVILGIQTPIWFAIVFVVLGDILLRKTRFLRQSYYVGGNAKAAAVSGIAVDKIQIFNYTLVGALTGIAAIIYTARLGVASVTAGEGLEMNVITGVIIGGASLAGGEGTVLGSLLGCFLMTLINNAMNLLGVDVYWQTFVTGATLLLAVLIDVMNKKYKARKDLLAARKQ